ncbi:hypothetical protein VN97_g12003, partial [Penicillium thymicola]
KEKKKKKVSWRVVNAYKHENRS